MCSFRLKIVFLTLAKTFKYTLKTVVIRGRKLKNKSVAKEMSKPPFLAPEVQWASKFAVFES